MGKGAVVSVVLCPQILQRIFLCIHTGVRTLIISVLEFSLCLRVRSETVVYISDCGDLVDFIGADLGADFRRSGNIGIAAAFLHFRKLANMIDGVADADMVIVNVGAGQDRLFTVKTGDNDAFSVLDGKQRVILAVNEADLTLVFVGIWKGEHAHDVYGFTVGHLASPLSFFGSVRFFSYSLSFSFAQSGIFSGLATPRTSEASQRQRSPEYSSSK